MVFGEAKKNLGTSETPQIRWSVPAWCEAAGNDNGLICQPGLVIRQHPRVERHVLPFFTSQKCWTEMDTQKPQP